MSAIFLIRQRHNLNVIYYIYVQSTPVILKSKDSLKYFEISVPRHIRFAELRKK